MTTCRHERTSLGAVYEYCIDCGAVHKRQPSTDPWHVCNLCRLNAEKYDLNHDGDCCPKDVEAILRDADDHIVRGDS